MNPWFRAAALSCVATAMYAQAGAVLPVTINSNPQGGSFTVSGAGCQPGIYIAPSTLQWNSGASCTVTVASPVMTTTKGRDVFVSWSDASQANPRTFAAPAQPAAYTFNLASEFLVTPAIYPQTSGSISGGGWIRQGSPVTLKATLVTGYRLVGWSNGMTGETITYTVNGVDSISAVAASTATVVDRPYAAVPIAPASGENPDGVNFRYNSGIVSGPYALNEYGQIVGERTFTGWFLWTPSTANSITGATVDLSTLTGVEERSAVINASGQIAISRAVDQHLFLWSPTAPNTAAGTAVEIGNTALPVPSAINDYGQVAGDTYVWTPATANGTTGTLVRNTTEWTRVVDINNAGQMLVQGPSGWRVFTPSSRGAATGTYAIVPSFAATGEEMVALNSAGLVLGHSCIAPAAGASPCKRRSFIASPTAGTAATRLVEPPNGFDSLVATAFNDAGDVVGHMEIGGVSTPFPFLYRDQRVYDLSTAASVLRRSKAVAINNAGQIAVDVLGTSVTGATTHNAYLVSPLAGGSNDLSLTLSRSEVAIGWSSGPLPSPVPVNVTLTGTNAAATAWSVTGDRPWIIISRSAGLGSGSFDILLNSGAPMTATEGTVTVTAAGKTKTVRVVLTKYSTSATKPPTGFVDEPANNATVSGAIAVTGWALDDIEVTRIEVYRKALQGEPSNNGQLFVGYGVFLEGARPDVANLYPGVPFNTRAGWGMQILTNMLPSNPPASGARGNGQHELFVYAFDKEGKSTMIGSRVINVNNANAVKPFGTLDTPASVATISGSQYTVWGWTLTPQPGVIPADGSTIWVFVDGVSLGHPVYNVYRADVSALFPDLQNSSGPVGYYYLDTTKLANGMHSIAWSVTDNLGRIEGIGSRLFFVQNAGAAAASDAKPVKSMRSAEREGIWFRTGYDPNASLQKLEGSEIAVEQGGRVELHVGGAAAVDFDGAASLPPGSTFSNGVFYWQLDAAFIASYELKFRDSDGTAMQRLAIRVTK